MFDNAQMVRRNYSSRQHMDEFLKDIADIPNSTFICAMRGRDIPYELPWGEKCELHGLDEQSRKKLFLSITGDAFPKDDPDLDTTISKTAGFPMIIKMIAQNARGPISGKELLGRFERIRIENIDHFRYRHQRITDRRRK